VSDDLASIRVRIAALSDLHRPMEIIALAQQGLALAPADSWLLGQLALAQMETDRSAARQAAEQAVAADPDDAWVHRVAATVQLGSGKDKAARRHAERAVALDPLDPNGHLLLARAYDACHLPSKAAAASDEVIRLAPSSPAGYVERSRLCIGLRDWRSAETWARRALELDPDDSAALNNLAVARQQQGKHAEALDLFSRAAAAEPGDKIAAENARNSAGNLGGVAIGGAATYLIIRVVIIAFRGEPFLGIGVVVALGAVLALVNRHRFERSVADLSPHLQAFAREQRALRWRDPSTWRGRTRRQRATRAAFLVLIFMVLAAVWVEARSASTEPDSPTVTVDPDYLACIANGDPSVDCTTLIQP
jgi:tetratricopeptide (TPR) repeat protein